MADWSYFKAHENGQFVRLGEQLGYAKANGIAEEILAACLARLVDAPIPRAERGSVEGKENYVISYVHSSTSSCLEKTGELCDRDYSADELEALAEASSLLPFFAWVRNEDVGDNSNLVVDRLDAHKIRVRAIDFEKSFGWNDEDDKEIKDWAPPGLTRKIDRQRVEESLARIEALCSSQIRCCCDRAGLPKKADALVARQKLLRKALNRFGWAT